MYMLCGKLSFLVLTGIGSSLGQGGVAGGE